MPEAAALSAAPKAAPSKRKADKHLRLAWVAERVFLAWVRTSIALIALGFLLARIGMVLESMVVRNEAARPMTREATLLGMGLIALGCLVSLVATWRFNRDRRGLLRGEPVRHRSDLSFVVGTVTPIAGIALIVFLWRSFR
jgi:putative membrane protein